MKFTPTHAFMGFNTSHKEEIAFLEKQIDNLKILTDNFFNYFLSQKDILNKYPYGDFMMDVKLENIGPFNAMTFTFKKDINSRVTITSGGFMVDSFFSGKKEIISHTFINDFEFEEDDFNQLCDKVNEAIIESLLPFN
ncbi:hypothetical protein [uncultured Paraglaciecola sp.]|uniref:hypothetical protein n=1 Tax=uncultured Paraglaciecola sp. TaxID=1765024 RepID=UPI0026120BF4|nr:hypothetical protein [uncultured Paraglaciecola sp.]